MQVLILIYLSILLFSVSYFLIVSALLFLPEINFFNHCMEQDKEYIHFQRINFLSEGEYFNDQPKSDFNLNNDQILRKRQIVEALYTKKPTPILESEGINHPKPLKHKALLLERYWRGQEVIMERSDAGREFS